MKKPVWVILAMGAVIVYLLGTPACTKEEDETSGYDKFYATVVGKWNVVYQGQFNSTDSTRDTLAGTPVDFMEFRNTDTVYSHTVLPVAETAPFTVLNVSRFLIGTDTIFNRSLTEGMLRFYYREPLTDTSYTERWVDLKKAE